MKKKLCLLLIAAPFFGSAYAQNFGSRTVLSAANDNGYVHVFYDIDNDGDTDIIVAATYADEVFWYKNLGNNTFSTRILINTSLDTPSDVGLLDVDEDGKKRPDHYTEYERIRFTLLDQEPG
ncbi:FG-GAP repeat domain-containing protein [Flavobacterium silvaticum]|uniref:VCBS repeat-containing protein n=1 Tax=Flavobacterium silvaticum TaxID=1852020 RepID=A0A972FYK7_9FLAO|nr:VCBS repeat-containing protein [Flavobacterium silvaticum]NMH27216.1 VCBS repeat-containing protein [Flavobacterium silvaticum]